MIRKIASLCVAVLLLATACGNKTFDQYMEEGRAALDQARTREEAAQAAELFTGAIAKNPDNAEARYLRGMALAKAGNMEAAREDFSETIRLEPGRADAYYRRALCATLMNPDDPAILPDLEKAVALDPGHQKARWQLMLQKRRASQ